MLLQILIAIGLFITCGECAAKHGKNACLPTKNLLIESLVFYKRCSLQNSVPATICRDCFGEYVNMLKSFETLVKTLDPKLNNKSCAAEYSDQNRLNIIPNELNGIKQFWNDAYCTNCYTDCHPESFPLNCTLINSYSEYSNSQSTFALCVDQSQKSNANPCDICSTDYNNLTMIYNGIKVATVNVCFDIEDNFLSKQKLWTSVINCQHSPTTPSPPSPMPVADIGFLPLLLIFFSVGILVASGILFYRKYVRMQYTRTYGSEDGTRSDPDNFNSSRLISLLRSDTDL